MPAIDFAVRQMVEGDFEAVAEIEAGVFTDWYRMNRKPQDPMAERTSRELRFATSFDPAGNLVAVASEGAIVGFIFSRTWGSVGWFGTFGVPTQLQGMGIGRELASRVAEYLRANSRTVGLETMPESGANIGLYTRLGFRLAYPTAVLELPLIREAERMKGLRADEVRTWDGRSARERARLLGEARAIGDAILPGLDYTREIVAIREHGFGETFVSEDEGGALEGFAVVRTEPFRKGDAGGRAYLHILAIHPDAEAGRVLSDLLRQVWARVADRGYAKLITGANGRYARALALLAGHGFRAVRAAIRMAHDASAPEFFAPSNAITLSRWAG